MKKYKIVVDTNFFIGAYFNKKSASFKIFNDALKGKIIFIFSEKTIKELNFILNSIKANPQFLKKIKKLLINSQKTNPHLIIKEIKDDPSDNKFLSLAVFSKADFILSNDKHLLSLKDFCGIPILTPRKFLEIYKIKQKH